MKRSWMAMLVVAGGFGSAMFGQQYTTGSGGTGRSRRPVYNGQTGSQYDSRDYARDPGCGTPTETLPYDGSYRCLCSSASADSELRLSTSTDAKPRVLLGGRLLEFRWRTVLVGRRLLDASAVRRRVLGASAVLRRAFLPGILGWRPAGLQPWICPERLPVPRTCSGSAAELRGSHTKGNRIPGGR
jgi:hypothetical protein